MKLWVKVTLGLLTSFGAGFTAGFLFHKRMNDVEFEEITEEEMQALEAGVQENVSPKENKIESDESLPTDKDELRNHLQGKVSYLKADQAAKEKYAKVWETVNGYSDKENADRLPVQQEEGGPFDGEEGFDEDFLEMIEEEQVEPGQVAPPHPISLVEFYDERNEYDKITVDWYEPNVFLDENEETIADLRSYFGDIDIVKLFEHTGADEDPDIRFIRNEFYSTDYEVIRHHRSWSETIGGSE